MTERYESGAKYAPEQSVWTEEEVLAFVQDCGGADITLQRIRQFRVSFKLPTRRELIERAEPGEGLARVTMEAMEKALYLNCLQCIACPLRATKTKPEVGHNFCDLHAPMYAPGLSQADFVRQYEAKYPRP